MSTADLQLPLPLDELRRILRDHGVVGASVFGSYARGEQTSKSDLDLFIKCRRGTSLFEVFDLQAELEKYAGVPVDLATKINPHFAEYIEPEMVEIKL